METDGIYIWDVKTQGHVRVFGALSMLPADYQQLCANARHGGSAAGWNCPNCCVSISNRLNVDYDINDHRHARSVSFSDQAILQIYAVLDRDGTHVSIHTNVYIHFS